MDTKIINKGTGAGGANTNLHGKAFEDKTDNEVRLVKDGFVKKELEINKSSSCEYLEKTFEDKTVVFAKQGNLKKYIKHTYNFEIFRRPDEAYIYHYNDGKKVIYILEKKAQHVDGSVIDKLLAPEGYIFEYKTALHNTFEVNYGFCVSSFLQKKILSQDEKFATLKLYLMSIDVPLLFGDDEDYFTTLDKWLAMNN